MFQITSLKLSLSRGFALVLLSVVPLSAAPATKAETPASTDAAATADGVLPPLLPPAVQHTPEEMRAFAERNSPAQIKALALELDELLDPAVPEMKLFREKVAAGQYDEALVLFRDRFMENCKDSLREFKLWSTSKPEMMMQGIIETQAPLKTSGLDASRESRPVKIGLPGNVNWLFQLDIENDKHAICMSLHTLNDFLVLVDAALKTNDPEYLKLWSEYLDDYVMNGATLLNTPPLFNVWRIFNVTLSLKELADGPVALREQVSPPTVARLALYLLKNQIATLMRTGPGMSSNQCVSAGTTLYNGAVVFKDFKIADKIMDRAEYSVASYMNRYYLPDGTDVERSPNYNKAMLNSFGEIKAATADVPPWVSDLKDKSMLRARFLASNVVQTGQMPRITVADMRDAAPVYENLEERIPEIFDDPDVLAMRERIYEGKESAEPSFMSEVYPFGGYAYIRSGWDEQDQMLVMTTGRKNYGKAQEDVNGIALTAFGQPLLVDSGCGAYSPDPRNNYFHSSLAHNTMLVDGIGQKQSRGASKKAFSTPLKGRWLNSAAFNVQEGLYADIYGNIIGHPETLAEDIQNNPVEISGVEHFRRVVFVRDLGLWVVLDTMKSDQPHRYTQTWNFPAHVVPTPEDKPWPPFFEAKGYQPGFQSEEVVLHEKDNRIETTNPKDANIAILNFSKYDLDYKKYYGQLEPAVVGWDAPWIWSKRLPKVDVHVSWQGEPGENSLLSLLVPIRPKAEGLKDVKPLQDGEARGFSATTAEGIQLSCLFAESAATLKLGNLEATADFLLVEKLADGTEKGVVFGCEEISVDGVAAAVTRPDFEFAIENGALRKTGDIRVPLDQPLLEVAEGSPIFSDSCHVTMSVSDPDAEIRYTLDGSEPTRKSAVYSKPIALDKSTTVKAKTWRVGLDPNTKEERFVDYSPVASLAVTQKSIKPEFPLPAAGASPGEDWQHGLNYKVYLAKSLKADRPALYYFYKDFPVVESGAGVAPFAKSGKLKTVIYEGFFEAPADGVYEFRRMPKDKVASTEIRIAGMTLELDPDGRFAIYLKKGLYPAWLRLTTPWGIEKLLPEFRYAVSGANERVLNKESFWCRAE